MNIYDDLGEEPKRNSDLAYVDQMMGTTHEQNKTLNSPIYNFHEILEEAYSIAFVNFDLNILTKQQKSLLTRYINNAENIGNADAELQQLDTFLGDLR